MVRQFVPDVETVRERFAEVEGRVAEAAGAAGRDPADVRVLVATKYVAAEHLGALRDAGIRLIGENRAQDLVAKHELYGDAFDYHFIGHLQSRKTRLVLPIVSLIHSVGSMSVVQEIEARAANATDVLLEVNIGGEESKSGVPLAEVDAFLEEAAAAPRSASPASCACRRSSTTPRRRAPSSCGRASWPNGFRQRGAERILSSSYRWAPAPTTRWPSRKGRPSSASGACSSDP